MIEKVQFRGERGKPDFAQAAGFECEVKFAVRAENLDWQGIEEFVGEDDYGGVGGERTLDLTASIFVASVFLWPIFFWPVFFWPIFFWPIFLWPIFLAAIFGNSCFPGFEMLGQISCELRSECRRTFLQGVG
jgi:hypothetical protein